MKTSTLISAAAGSALLLSGCTGTDTDSEAPEPPEPGPEEAILDEYFTALVSEDVEQMEKAADTAAEDSMAARYLTHQQNVARANRVNGYGLRLDEPVVETDVEVEGDAVSVCVVGICADYGDVTFEDGKLASFSIDGTSVDDRIVIGNGEVVTADDLIGYEVLSAAPAADGPPALVVVVRFHSYDQELRNVAGSTRYRNPGGEEIDVDLIISPLRLYADSHQLGILEFPRSEVGGEVFTKFTLADEERLVSGEARFPVAQG